MSFLDDLLARAAPIEVDNLTVGGIVISAGTTAPTASAPIGSICFNSNAAVGSPIGWVYDGNTWHPMPLLS